MSIATRHSGPTGRTKKEKKNVGEEDQPAKGKKLPNMDPFFQNVKKTAKMSGKGGKSPATAKKGKMPAGLAAYIAKKKGKKS